METAVKAAPAQQPVKRQSFLKADDPPREPTGRRLDRPTASFDCFDSIAFSLPTFAGRQMIYEPFKRQKRDRQRGDA
jgi:hypothetical protein